MTRLSSKDLTTLLDVVRRTYAVRDSHSLAGYVMHAVGQLVPAENSTCSELDPSGRALVEVITPVEFETPELQALFQRYIPEHPVIAYYARTGDGSARTISDFATRTQMHGTALYNEYVMPYYGTEYQMAIAVTATPTRIVGATVARSGRDFSDRERLLLDLFRPHIVQARRTAEVVGRLKADIAGLRHGVDAAPLGMVLVDRAGRTRLVTRRARQWMGQYFPGTRRATALPDAIRCWIAHQESAWATASDAAPALLPLVVASEAGTLTIRLLVEDDGLLLLFDEEPTLSDNGHLADIGLTPREIEVLVWVAAGKTSAEIGDILGSRPRTIEKHLERIYGKLGVETRTAAAAFVHKPGGLAV